MINHLERNELEYLVSVWASEESVLYEVCLEAQERGIEIERVQDILFEFLALEEIGIHENLEDYSDAKSREALQDIMAYRSFSEPALFLTEKGWDRFDNDTWGISVARAREILFNNGMRSPSGSGRLAGVVAEGMRRLTRRFCRR